jgi:hypothetical protein
MRTPRVIGWGLLALAAGLAANSLLGPLVFGVIDYRYGPSMTNQGIGLDAAVLALAVPVAVLAGVLTMRGHLAGPVLALGPAAFAVYMLPQYVIGPEYGRLPGNNERFFSFHLALFVLAVTLLVGAWSTIDDFQLSPGSWGSDRRRAWLMAGVVAFILLRWAPALLALATGDRTDTAYQDNPTAFLLVALLDLGLVVPTAVAAAVGLRRSADWARTACYLVIGWFSFVPVSVAAMAITMQLRGDPLASVASATFLTVVAGVSLAAAAALYRPLLSTPATTPPVAADSSERPRLVLDRGAR